MKLKYVCVHVMDINTSAGWWEYNKREHRKENKTIPVVGILVDRDNEWVILASSYNKTGKDWLNEVSIPTSIVKSVVILKTEDV